MDEKWKIYLNFLPLISLLSIGFGYLHLYLYYSIVGIEIFSFISTSEILLAFIPFLPFITIIAIAATAALILIPALENHFDKQIEKISNKYLRYLFNFMVFGIMGLIYLFYTWLLRATDTLVQVLCAVGFLALVMLILNFSKGIKSFFKISTRDYVIVFICLILITWINATNKSKSVISEKPTHFKIKTNESGYTNNEYIYYGRTRDYTFLVRLNDSTTAVIRNSSITIEELKK